MHKTEERKILSWVGERDVENSPEEIAKNEHRTKADLEEAYYIIKTDLYLQAIESKGWECF